MSNSAGNEPQYKVGDIVNGHILTVENEWKPVAEAPAAAEKPKRKWYLRKRVLIPVSVLAFIIIIGSINPPPKADDADIAKTPVAVVEEPAAEEAVAEATPKTPPAPKAGTVANPMPQPYVAKGLLGGEKYSLTGRVSHDGPDVTQWNMFNDPAPAGFKWVVVELTMAGIDEDGVQPSLASFDLSLSTAEGNKYNEDSGIVLGDGMPRMYEGPTLYPGSAFTGYVSFLVPEGSTGFMLHDNGNYITL